MQVDIEVHNGWLRVHTAPVEFVPDIAPGPGWFESSRLLERGVRVVEGVAEPELRPPDPPD